VLDNTEQFLAGAEQYPKLGISELEVMRLLAAACDHQRHHGLPSARAQ
jgi:hypothetical protein